MASVILSGLAQHTGAQISFLSPGRQGTFPLCHLFPLPNLLGARDNGHMAQSLVCGKGRLRARPSSGLRALCAWWQHHPLPTGPAGHMYQLQENRFTRGNARLRIRSVEKGKSKPLVPAPLCQVAQQGSDASLPWDALSRMNGKARWSGAGSILEEP